MGAEHFRLEVEDSGIGISDEDLAKLFVEFQQLDASASKRYQGTGLGLALTKRIVEAHGGRIEVRSIVGSGSNFSAVLARNMAAIEAVDIPLVAPRPARSSTVLVVHDDPAALRVIEAALEASQWRVVCKDNVPDALDAAAAEPPGMLVVDLLALGHDGSDLIRRFRDLPGCGDVPIFAFVSRAAERRARGGVHGG